MTSSGDAQLVSPVRVLSTHAGYHCRHSGACCTSGWPIPIERDALAGLRHALDRRVVVPVAPAGQRLFEFPPDAPPDTPAILNSSQGRCVFFRQSPAGHCSIQAQLGPRAVPLACRQFPRRQRARSARGVGHPVALLPHRGVDAADRDAAPHRGQPRVVSADWRIRRSRRGSGPPAAAASGRVDGLGVLVGVRADCRRRNRRVTAGAR